MALTSDAGTLCTRRGRSSAGVGFQQNESPCKSQRTGQTGEDKGFASMELQIKARSGIMRAALPHRLCDVAGAGVAAMKTGPVCVGDGDGDDAGSSDGVDRRRTRDAGVRLRWRRCTLGR